MGLHLCLKYAEIIVQPFETFVPRPAIAFEPVIDILEGARLNPAGTPLSVALRAISPARSSTLRCLETAGSLMSKGSARSMTVVSPKARRARIARRAGSARAAKVVLRFLHLSIQYAMFDSHQSIGGLCGEDMGTGLRTDQLFASARPFAR
jgi:hypothetical protein